MPFTKIERLPGEPIFICTYEGIVTSADIVSSYDAALACWTDDLAKTGFHSILDASSGQINFTEAMSVLRPSLEYAKRYEKFVPHIHYYTVGTGAMIKLLVNFFHLVQFGGYEIPMYLNLEDAIEAARTAAAKYAAKQTTASSEDTP